MSQINKGQINLNQKLTEKFNAADIDASGTLSKAEFADALSGKGLSQQRAEKLFSRIDANQDGQISLEEQQQKVAAMQERIEGLSAKNATPGQGNFDALASLFEILDSSEQAGDKKQQLQGLMKDIKSNGPNQNNLTEPATLSNQILPSINITA